MSLYLHLQSMLFPPQGEQRSFIPQFRLEGIPKDAEGDESLAMRIADPLWMLGRQWQFGEFLAEENGSPICVKARYKKQKINHLGSTLANLDQRDISKFPLEYCIENLPQRELNLRQKVQAGQYLEQLIHNFQKTSPIQLIEDLRQNFPLEKPSDALWDEATKVFFSIMKGEVIDGEKVYYHLKEQDAQTSTYGQAWTEYSFWYQKTFGILPEVEKNYWHSEQLVHKFIAQHLTDEEDEII